MAVETKPAGSTVPILGKKESTLGEKLGRWLVDGWMVYKICWFVSERQVPTSDSLRRNG